MAVEVGVNDLAKVVEYGSVLLGACADRSPDAFAPLSATPASGALGDAAVDDYETYGLFREVVGWFDARRGDEAGVGIAVEAKTPGQVLGRRTPRRPDGSVHHLATAFSSALEKPLGGMVSRR